MYATEQNDSGSVRWERSTRTVHQIALTLTDDLVAPIAASDTVELVLTHRNGVSVVRVPARAVWKMTRPTKEEVY